MSILRHFPAKSLVPSACLLAGILQLVPVSGARADWPHFRGPDGSGVCVETGLMQRVPDNGPQLLWKLDGCGTGYSSISIAKGRIYTMGDLGSGDDQSQFVICFDLASRRRLWTTRIGPPHKDGSRCTPTIDGDRLYALGTASDLVCLRADTGRLVWKRNLERDFGGTMMSGWRWSESPLVDGDRVICTPGANEAGLVALSKQTGDVIWKTHLPSMGDRGKDGAGYASAVAADIEGVRQYLTILGRGAISVAAEDGRFLWGYNRIANKVANIPSPIVRGNHVFVTTSYKTGSALLKITKNGNQFEAEEVYYLSPKEFENHHGGVVLVGDYLYGGSGQNMGTPVCIEFLTGKITWSEREWMRSVKAGGSAAVLYADGQLYFRYEKDGRVALLAANPKKFEPRGMFTAAVTSGKSWAHPVIQDGRLYLRSHDRLMCYDVRAK